MACERKEGTWCQGQGCANVESDCKTFVLVEANEMPCTPDTPEGGNDSLMYWYKEFEYVRALLGFPKNNWIYVLVKPEDFEAKLDNVARQFNGVSVLANFCEGELTSPLPAVRVAEALHSRKLPVIIGSGTGDIQDVAFIQLTSSKHSMHEAFATAGVRFPKTYNVLISAGEQGGHDENAFDFPLLVKTDFGCGSSGLSDSSIVNSKEELDHEIQRVVKSQEGLVVQQFVDGREFTVLLTDSLEYHPMELLFAEGSAGIKPDGFAGQCVQEKVGDPMLIRNLQNIARQAYQAVGGRRYGRVDIRSDSNGRLFVLEVNNIPGFSIMDPSYRMAATFRDSCESEKLDFLLDMGFQKHPSSLCVNPLTGRHWCVCGACLPLVPLVHNHEAIHPLGQQPHFGLAGDGTRGGP